MICIEKEIHEAEDAILKEKNMKEAIKYLTSKKKLKSQAEEFGCELKPLIFLCLQQTKPVRMFAWNATTWASLFRYNTWKV